MSTTPPAFTDPANSEIRPSGVIRRTTFSPFPGCVKYTFPTRSTVIPNGLSIRACTAAPPSPAYPGVPVPAIVLIRPSAVTFRIRALNVSAMYRFPCPSKAIAYGCKRFAVRTGPNSTNARLNPFPATVEIVPAAVTRRTRRLFRSAINRFPDASTPNPSGDSNDAEIAGPLSPANPAAA